MGQEMSNRWIKAGRMGGGGYQKDNSTVSIANILHEVFLVCFQRY